MQNMTEYFGEPISTYSIENAIEDGVLVRVGDQFPNCLFTSAVMVKIAEEVAKGRRTYEQVAFPLMMDVINVGKANAGESKYTGDDLDGNVTGETLWFAMNELNGITVMFPSDD